MATPIAAAAKPGERWGEFTFFDDPSFHIPTSEITPPPRPLEGGEGDSLYNAHPGYREFKQTEELAAFVDGRAPVPVPTFIPDNAELLGGYAVEGSDGEIISVGISYDLGEGDASINNSDLWISYDRFLSRPMGISTKDNEEVLAPVLLTVQGNEAIYRGLRDHPGASPHTRASLNWYTDDGAFWTVQARGLDMNAIVEIAESLEDQST
jgi:hypothetical protein